MNRSQINNIEKHKERTKILTQPSWVKEILARDQPNQLYESFQDKFKLINVFLEITSAQKGIKFNGGKNM